MDTGKRLLRLLPQIRRYLLGMGALAVLSGLSIIVQALCVGRAVNGAFLAREGLQQLFGPLLLLLVVIVIRAMLAWGSEVLSALAAVRAKTQLRERLLTRLQALGPAYSSGERSGELASTFVEGVDSLDAYFGQYLPQVCAVACIPLLVLLVVFIIDPLSGLTLLLSAPLLPVLLALIGKRASKLNKRQWQQMSLLSAHFLDVLQGLTTLKQFGRSKIQSATIGRLSEQYRRISMKVLRVAFLSAFVMELGATLSMAVVAVEIGLRLLYGFVPFEQALLVLLLTPEFYLPMRQLGTRFHASMAASAASERMFAILDQPMATGQGEPTEVRPTLTHELRFDHVSFFYSHISSRKRRDIEEDGWALRDISFSIKRGQKVALVGASGAGKSTIASLLLRFHEPEQGSILADGVALQNWSARQWRDLLAWVPQRPYLFDATIAENIRMGCPDASLDEVIVAARNAQLHDFIQSLPQQYETQIGERGARLSGGQVQRLSLARAFLKDAPLLVLDEATANLDSENEQQILDAIERLTRGRMTLIIAHRLHTVAQADQVIVLNKGSIQAVGTHHELVGSEPLYREMLALYRRSSMEVA